MTLEQALETLAHKTSDEIAQLFRTLNIHPSKNTWMWSCNCPMAVYLSQQTGKPVSLGLTCAMCEDRTILLSHGICNFIHNVDNGKYLDLVYPSQIC